MDDSILGNDLFSTLAPAAIKLSEKRTIFPDDAEGDE